LIAASRTVFSSKLSGQAIGYVRNLNDAAKPEFADEVFAGPHRTAWYYSFWARHEIFI
jgi:hypothetical protein